MKKLGLIFAFSFLLFALSSSPAAAQEPHPDKNLKIRGWEPVGGQLNLIDFSHPIDTRAPQLSTLIEGVATPAITSLYQVYQWDWTTNSRDGLYPRPPDAPADFATLVGFAANGRAILVPESGYTLGGGFEAFVLYADADSITLQYTCDDSVARGYTIHLVGLNVDSGLLALYNQLDQAGRAKLPILSAGARIGSGVGEILVATRDSGSFLDPRWRNDWWQQLAAASGQDLELTAQSVAACTGDGERRDCANPRVGPTDAGCYGALVNKDAPDETIFDTIAGIFRRIFRWGGDDEKIKVTDETIPIEGDLDYLLGYFPLGTPGIIDDENLAEFRDGVLPKLTPPGDPLETLHNHLFSFLEDYSKGILDAESCKAPGYEDEEEKDVRVSVPDIYGLAQSATRLAFSLTKLPGTAMPGYALDPGNPTLASQRIARDELSCKNTVAATHASSNVVPNVAAASYAAQDPTIKLTQTGGCPYGPGNCPDDTTAPELPICIPDDSEGELQETEELGECAVNPITYACAPGATVSCPTIDLTCPASGQVTCFVPDCGGGSENQISLLPKISFLPDYTQYIIDTYSIFKSPTVREKPLDGKGQIEWTYGGESPGNDDDGIRYPKLGTVECLENYVKRALSPPGHNIPEKQNCFED